MKELHEDFQSYFADRLVKLRMSKGVSAREMSLSIGQSEGYVAQIERRHNLPSMTVFTYMCEYLGVSPKDFFDEKQENPELLQKLIDKMKTLSQEELECMLGIVGIIGKNKNRHQPALVQRTQKSLAFQD